MAKVAFVITPEYTRTMPHLGIAYLRAIASQHGHETRYFDLSAKYRLESFFASILHSWINTYSKPTRMQTLFAFLPSIVAYFEPPPDMNQNTRMLFLLLKSESEKMATEILEYQPDIVCFSIFDTTLFLSLSVARELKKRNNSLKIIFGGPFLNDKRVQDFVLLFNDCIDHIVVGEGEEIINDLIENSIPSQNRIICTEAISSLDNLPFPVFDGCDFEMYKKVMYTEKNWR